MAIPGHKNIVIIQLSGGNDGLNTIIPFRNDLYFEKRPQLAIPKKKVLKVSDELGFHPSLAALRPLFDKGEMCVINNVGYPNPNRSHFRSLDIWHSASDSDKVVSTGWLGRYLDAYCDRPHEAIEVDDMLSLAMKGEQLNGMAVKDPRVLFHTTNDSYLKKLTDHAAASHLSDDNMGYLFKTMIQTGSSAAYIHETSKTYTSSIKYPKTALAGQLKTVGKFINSSLETKVYYASVSGFDTHANQQVQQERLLKQYAEAVQAFVADLKKGGTFSDTLILTFSEFGRRVNQNASKGTDHGTASNVFAMGGSLKKAGFFNEGPDLSNLDKNGDLIYKVDFRRIYATVLDKWLGVSSRKILGKPFQTMHFV